MPFIICGGRIPRKPDSEYYPKHFTLTETVALEANKANMRVDNDLNILLLFSYQSNLFLDEQQVK